VEFISSPFVWNAQSMLLTEHVVTAENLYRKRFGQDIRFGRLLAVAKKSQCFINEGSE
jgi:hypothetical protein